MATGCRGVFYLGEYDTQICAARDIVVTSTHYAASMKRLFLCLGFSSVVLALTSTSSVVAQTPAAPVAVARKTPALVVLLVVDQFRADYVSQYGDRWTGGLRRLVDSGAYFRQAAYPYFATETCPGHATVGTGALPRTHGIVANGWYDRGAKQAVVCTTDVTKPVAVGGGEAYESHGARYLRVPTLADELRAQSSAARVVSLSLKARASITMAGHAGDAVWLEDAGAWASSSQFISQVPATIGAFVRAHPVGKDYERVWTLLRTPASYMGTDDGLAEQSPDGWTAVFPHSLSRPAGPDRIFYDNWRRTPFSDEYLGLMAAAAAKDLGHGAGTDMLAVSFSATDYVGHRFGPRSLEVQDTLARLDVTIGKLLDALDASVGRGRYVVALTGDHGVAPLAEQQQALKLDAGRFAASDIQTAIEGALKSTIGGSDYFMPGSKDAGNNASDVYFTPDTLAKLLATPSARRAVSDAVEKVPGVARTYWASEVLSAGGDAAPDLRAFALSFNADRNGDFLVIPKPYWLSSTGGTGHGTMHLYDQRVPILLMGFGIRPGRFDASVTPADIAPTLAQLAGVTLAKADGHVLHEAIVR